jgi:hypothetical protein
VAAPIESPSIINTRLLTGPIESSHLATWSIPTSASRRPFGRHVRERRRPHDPPTRLSSSAALGARRRSRRRDALAESARGGEGRGGLKARRRELRSPFAVIHHSACGNNTRGSRGGGGRRRDAPSGERRGLSPLVPTRDPFIVIIIVGSMLLPIAGCVLRLLKRGQTRAREIGCVYCMPIR